MTTVLHVLTDAGDELAPRLIALQREEPGVGVEVLELPERGADYAELLRRVFAADKAVVW